MKRTNKYTDGVIKVYKSKAKKTEFNAPKNAKRLSDLELLVKLPFDEKSKREKDLEYCYQLGNELSLKLVTPMCGETIGSQNKVIVERTLYDVIYVDTDKKNREMYLYLQEVEEIA